MGLVPDYRPEYVSLQTWADIGTMTDQDGHLFLHNIEIHEAERREHTHREAIRSGISMYVAGNDIMEHMGGAEEVERLIGSDWMKIIFAAPAPNIFNQEQLEP